MENNVLENLSECDKYKIFLNFVLDHSAMDRSKQKFLLENVKKNSYKLTALENKNIVDVWEFNLDKCFRICNDIRVCYSKEWNICLKNLNSIEIKQI